MTSSLNIELIKRHDLEVGSFYFCKNHIVAGVNEGFSLTFKKAYQVLELGKAYYGNATPFVVIRNRVNSYCFNPTAH